MSIKFKALERAEPGVPGGGKKKWYAVSVFDRKANLSDLTVEIERISTVNRADVVAVLSALVQLIPKYLTNSFILYLGELGNFRSNIKSRGQQTERELNRSNIFGNKVIFTPGPGIKRALKLATYEKVQ